jgi:hypothetical protein
MADDAIVALRVRRPYQGVRTLALIAHESVLMSHFLKRLLLVGTCSLTITWQEPHDHPEERPNHAGRPDKRQERAILAKPAHASSPQAAKRREMCQEHHP